MTSSLVSSSGDVTSKNTETFTADSISSSDSSQIGASAQEETCRTQLWWTLITHSPEEVDALSDAPRPTPSVDMNPPSGGLKSSSRLFVWIMSSDRKWEDGADPTPRPAVLSLNEVKDVPHPLTAISDPDYTSLQVDQKCLFSWACRWIRTTVQMSGHSRDRHVYWLYFPWSWTGSGPTGIPGRCLQSSFMESSRVTTRDSEASSNRLQRSVTRRGGEERAKEPNEPRGVASKGDGAGAEPKCRRQSQWHFLKRTTLKNRSASWTTRVGRGEEGCAQKPGKQNKSETLGGGLSLHRTPSCSPAVRERTNLLLAAKTQFYTSRQQKVHWRHFWAKCHAHTSVSDEWPCGRHTMPSALRIHEAGAGKGSIILEWWDEESSTSNHLWHFNARGGDSCCCFTHSEITGVNLTHYIYWCWRQWFPVLDTDATCCRQWPPRVSEVWMVRCINMI